MGIIIFAIVVLILVALCCYAVALLPIQPPINTIVQVLIVLVGVLAIANRAGML